MTHRFFAGACAVILVGNTFSPADSRGGAEKLAPLVVKLYTSEDRLVQGHWVELIAEVTNQSDTPTTISNKALLKTEIGARHASLGAPKDPSVPQPTSRPGDVADEESNSVVVHFDIPSSAACKFGPSVNFQGIVTDLPVEPNSHVFLPIIINLGRTPTGKLRLSAALSIKDLGTFQSDVRETEVVAEADDGKKLKG